MPALARARRLPLVAASWALLAPWRTAQGETRTTASADPAGASRGAGCVDGPRVDGDAWMLHCRPDVLTLAEAEGRCLADEECTVLHDFGCDGVQWRQCISTVDQVRAAGAARDACTRLCNVHVCVDSDHGPAGKFENTRDGFSSCEAFETAPALCLWSHYYDASDFTARDMCCACGGGTDTKQALDSDSVPRRARSRPVLEEPATDTGYSTGAGVGSPFNAGPGAFTSRPPLEAIVLVFETEAITRAANLGHAQSYVSQLEEDGVPFRIIGADEPYLGWGHKWHALQHVLDRIPPSTVVVVSDSRDVLLNAGSAPAAGRLVAAFEKLVAGAPPGAVVAGAEGRCCVAALTSVQPGGFFAPGGSRAARACSSGRPGCPWVRSGTRPWERFMGALAAERGAGGGEVFLNAGLVAGRAADLARLVHRMNITVEEDDQAVLSDLLYRTPDMIVLDYNQTLFGSSRYWIAMEDGGCPYVQASPTTGLEHLEYGTRPVFLHGAAHFQECLDFMAQLLRVAALAPTRRSLQEHRWGRSDGNGDGYGRSDGNGDGYGLTSTSMGMSDSSTISSTSARTGTTLTATTTRTPRTSPLWSLLLAADGATGDHLGRSVSVSSSGSLVVAGAWLDDDSGTDSGSAYVFDGYTGVQLHKLLAGDGAADGEFGRSVCVSSDGSFVAVGAPNSGSVYIFDGATGAQVHELVADDGADFDMFGISVSMTSDGSHVLVGAYLDDDSGTDSGSAYVFDGSTGVQLVKLLADDGADDDGFGRSVSMSSDGGLVVVGACKTDSGSAYVFNGLTGMQLFKLLADDEVNGHYFGCSVSVSSDASRVVVGAYQDDVSGSRSGSAYVFDGNSGVQMYKLLADDGAADDYFGFSVSVSSDGSRVAVGALKDDARGSVSGSAYVFDGNTGSQLHKLVADDGAAGDQFGFSVSLSSDGSRVAVGAVLDDDRGYDSGSVYVCSLTTGNSTSTSTLTITSATASDAAVGTLTLTTASFSTPATSDTTHTASSTLAEPPAVALTSTSPSKTPDAETTASTITTLATITTSTTFTEDPLVSTISGTMTLIVSDPTAFVGDTRIIAAVSEGIANAVRVQNHQVSVALSADRRLAVPTGRGLAAEAGPVEVSYEITAPAGPSSASGTSRSHIAAVLTADNITSVMQESLSSSLDVHGVSYDLTVERLAVLTATTSEANVDSALLARSVPTDSEASIGLVVIVAIVLVCCVGMSGSVVLLVFRRYALRRAKQRGSNSIPASSNSHLPEYRDTKIGGTDFEVMADNASDDAPSHPDFISASDDFITGTDEFTQGDADAEELRRCRL